MNLRDVDLNLLIAFDALLRERHVTRAAERLNMSQSSMSVALAKLRDLFQDDLLTRAPGGMVSTERAESLWPRVRTAMAAIGEVFEPSAQFDPATSTATYRLIVIDYIDMILMPLVMQKIRALAPGVTVQVLQPNPRRFGGMLAAGELDLALTYFPDPPDFLKTRHLFDDRFVAICAKDHPVLALSRDGHLDAQTFCALPHITIEPELAQVYNVLIDESLQPQGLRRDVRLIKSNFLSLASQIESTDLVASIPARLASHMKRLASIEVFEIPLDLSAFEVRMLWHPRTNGVASHEWLRSLILASARCS